MADVWTSSISLLTGAENEMQSQDHQFCNFQQIRTLVMTWNAGASTPSSLRSSESDAAFFPDLLRGSESPDILVFGFQELVDLEDKKTTASKFCKVFEFRSC